jgi:hypothetical protein
MRPQCLHWFLLGISLTHGQATDSPFPDGTNPLRADWEGANRRVSPPFTSPFPPPSAESHSQMQESGVQDDHADARSSHEQVEDTTPKRLTKKEREMLRKRAQRLNDIREFRKICELLEIQEGPKNTLVHRSEYLFFSSRRRY